MFSGCVCVCADVHVGLEMGRLIQQARLQQSMSQKDLAAVRGLCTLSSGVFIPFSLLPSLPPSFPPSLPPSLPLPPSLQKINEKVVVVVDYESGRALPNPQIISKLERALGGCG